MRQIIISVMFMLGISQVVAQDIQRPDSYNYQRGLEAIQEEKIDEAMEFFNKDINENPTNGYSYSWIALLRDKNEEYGRALSAVDMAIKYLPKNDAEYIIFAYSTRAGVYLHLGDTAKALVDYNTAIKVKPDEENLYENRAQIYYELGKYDLADADYRKMTELKPGETMGYMGLGRNANAQHRWNDAIKLFDYVVKLDNTYSSAYAFRAESYFALEKWNEATDDIMSALSLGSDKKALYLLTAISDPAMTMFISKMKIQSMKYPNDAKWPYLMATTYQQGKQYKKAIESYEEANKLNASPIILSRISDCYSEMGMYNKALISIDQSLNMDSTNLANHEKKAEILYDLGKVEDAIEVYNKILSILPDYDSGYCQRAWFKKLSGDLEGAIEDMTMCIVLDPENSFAYQVRGDVYIMLEKKELAEADFKKVIEIEDMPEKYSFCHYAYQSLGQYNKAIEIMDTLLSRAENDGSVYYDAASIYARMGYKVKAIEYLRMAFENGYHSVAHVERDPDMDSIRDMEEFKALIMKYDIKD